MVDLFSGENIRFAATDDTFELLVCDVDNSTSAISDFTQSLHLRHPSWTVSILQEEVLHPVFFGRGDCGETNVSEVKGQDSWKWSTWMQLTQEYMLADTCENRQNWAVHPSYLLSSPLWQPLRLCSSIVQLSSCLSADILMHQTEQRRGSFTAAGRALIGHGNVCKPWRKSMAEGRNSRKRLWEQLFLQRRGGWRSELVDPSGGSEQLFGEAESSFLNRSNAERGKG